MRRPPRQPHTLNRRAAPRAGLTLAAVHAELVLEPAPLAAAADVISDGRTLQLDGPRQHRLNGVQKAVRLGGSDGVSGSPGVDPGLKASLVRVNVPDARDERLVQ